MSSPRLVAIFALLLSLLLHATILLLLKPYTIEPISSSAPPLLATLSSRQPTVADEPPARPLPAQESAVATRRVERPTAPVADRADIDRAKSAASEAPTVDLEAAFAMARTHGRAPNRRRSLDAPKPPLTVESAIARATAPDVVIETRGANGENVTMTRHSRCVTPLLVPHYMQGMTIPTLCEARKG
ncbi:MAG: hypothetical protein KJ634_14150 [Gammaproteobacteria bacterium]|nr:hypothetical protein [Gammaproteobacteria bacterium]MBU1416755.1 hypothetical protein [Gammaproteobacteria bacterium]